MPNEICILCGKETTVDINTHVDYRTGYIEGAGQLCAECYLKVLTENTSQYQNVLLMNTPTIWS